MCSEDLSYRDLQCAARGEMADAHNFGGTSIYYSFKNILTAKNLLLHYKAKPATMQLAVDNAEKLAPIMFCSASYACVRTQRKMAKKSFIVSLETLKQYLEVYKEFLFPPYFLTYFIRKIKFSPSWTFVSTHDTLQVASRNYIFNTKQSLTTIHSTVSVSDFNKG